MKTKHSSTPVPQQPASIGTQSPLAPLLARTAQADSSASQAHPPASSLNGLVLGALQDVDATGTPYVHVAQLGLERVAVRTLVPLSVQDIGRQLVLGFENGQAASPIVLGLMHQQERPTPSITSPHPLHIEQDGERTIIEAAQELELRCGEAVILLQADGRIQLRGEYITSHASAGQRILGGSVQIN